MLHLLKLSYGALKAVPSKFGYWVGGCKNGEEKDIMSIDEFENYARDLAYKSTFSFTLLSFSTLALSMQFSTGFGRDCLTLLFASWFFLLTSCFSGGWIITKMPIFYRINAGRWRVENYLTTIKSSEFQSAVRIGSAQTPSGETWTIEGLQATLKEENGKIAFATKNMKAIESKLPMVHKTQTWTYVFGLLFNMGFVIVNLICNK